MKRTSLPPAAALAFGLALLAAGPAAAQRAGGPAEAEDGGPGELLRRAQSAMRGGQTAQAADMLERAETRLLTGVEPTKPGRGEPAFHASEARRALMGRDRAEAMRHTNMAIATFREGGAATAAGSDADGRLGAAQGGGRPAGLVDSGMGTLPAGAVGRRAVIHDGGTGATTTSRAEGVVLAQTGTSDSGGRRPGGAPGTGPGPGTGRPGAPTGLPPGDTIPGWSGPRGGGGAAGGSANTAPQGTAGPLGQPPTLAAPPVGIPSAGAPTLGSQGLPSGPSSSSLTGGERPAWAAPRRATPAGPPARPASAGRESAAPSARTARPAGGDGPGGGSGGRKRREKLAFGPSAPYVSRRNTTTSRFARSPAPPGGGARPLKEASPPMDLRNVAIIAHVDHGKTTLVDNLLKQAGAFRTNQVVAERAMDRNDLERERGITILAKCTAVEWQGTKINIVDTPGHADFGGEVERILSMVDGAIVLVDAAEGPLPQTKFVVGKALARGIRPIVVINKVDRQDARPDEVLNEVFDLFAALGADDDQLDFPILYASGRQGWADDGMEGPKKDLSALFDLVLRHVPAPGKDATKPFAMTASILEADNFLGRILTGRVEQGAARVNMPLKILRADGSIAETGRLTKLLSFRGLERVPVETAEAGDIIAIAGLEAGTIPDTVCAPEVAAPLEAVPVDPPTLSMTFRINDGPLGGREGKKVTSRQIRERLFKESEGNVAIRVKDSEEADSFEVAGRGELQLGVLIEQMRREGFELTIGRPRVLTRENEQTGEREEPFEEALIDVDEGYSGVVVEKMAQRKGMMQDMRPSGGGKVRLTFHVPSRGLIGYHGEFLTDTRGTGIMNRLFLGYRPWAGPIEGRRNGSLISNSDGEAVQYALFALQERGALFVDPGAKVYIGLILGEHSRENDLDVNPIKEKKLTNIRAAGKDEALLLTPPRRIGLEQAIAYIEDDELVEVTPSAIRLRKRHLDPHERKRHARRADSEAA
jgi:GTP-binding protein